MAKLVRYKVVKPCFVNGSLYDPKGRTDMYVAAQEGLESAALVLAPEVVSTASLPPSAGDDVARLEKELADEKAAHEVTRKALAAQAADAGELFAAQDADLKREKADLAAARADLVKAREDLDAARKATTTLTLPTPPQPAKGQK